VLVPVPVYLNPPEPGLHRNTSGNNPAGS